LHYFLGIEASWT